MHIFLDSLGRMWPISIHIAAAKQLRGRLNVNLYGLIDNNMEGLGKLLSDPILLSDVIFCICKEEAEKQNVTQEEFDKAIWGDALGRAAKAFLEELTDFFPEEQTRTALRKALEAAYQVQEMAAKEQKEKLENLDLATMAFSAMKSNNSSGVSPELSESIPDPSLSENSG